MRIKASDSTMNLMIHSSDTGTRGKLLKAESPNSHPLDLKVYWGFAISILASTLMKGCWGNKRRKWVSESHGETCLLRGLRSAATRGTAPNSRGFRWGRTFLIPMRKQECGRDDSSYCVGRQVGEGTPQWGHRPAGRPPLAICLA